MPSEGSDCVPGVDIEIARVFKRLLTPILVIVGSKSVDGKIVVDGSEFVVAFKRLLMSRLVIVGKVRVVGRIVIDDSETDNGRIVIDGSEIDDGRIVRDDGKSESVTGGNKVAVTLSIPDTTANKLVTGEMPDMLGIEATGIVFKIGLPSGPG